MYVDDIYKLHKLIKVHLPVNLATVGCRARVTAEIFSDQDDFLSEIGVVVLVDRGGGGYWGCC